MDPILFNAGEAIIAFVYIFFPLFLGLIHAHFIKERGKKVDLLLSYYLFIGVGIQGVSTGLLQMIKPQMVVSFVEWPYSPFLIELGMANLAFGILGILSLWLNNSWKMSAAIAYGLFLLFTGIGHIINILRKGTHPGDAGAFLWSDLFVPIALSILITLQRRHFIAVKNDEAK
jgi:hypothetical protein